jgi:hypothetical protein
MAWDNDLIINMKRFLIIISIIIVIAYMAVSVVVLSRHGYLGERYNLSKERMAKVDSVINNAIAADDFP